MVDELDLDAQAEASKLGTASRIIKNSGALFFVTFLTRGAGLVIAMFVARYLGPAAMGAFAAVMGLAQLFEIIGPLGQRYVVIREVARHPTRVHAYWVSASLVALVPSTVMGTGLVVFAHLVGYDSMVLPSIYIVSSCLPVTSLFSIAQAILQGLERMEFMTVATFAGRFLGIMVMWGLLIAGLGVEAAFIGRGVFQITALLAMAWAALRLIGVHRSPGDWRPDLTLCRATLGASSFFAMQDFVNIALIQVGAVILPMLVTLEAVGMYGAADRVQQTVAMVVPWVTMAILPTLSRSFIASPGRAAVLAEKALKLLLLAAFPFAFVTTAAANKIVPLLYGARYEMAVPVLQIMVWSQVFYVADAVMHQAMMASDNERAMVRRSTLSLVVDVVLVLLLAPRYGAMGAAWATVLTRALNLGLDIHFVLGRVFRLDLVNSAGRPLLCAALSGVAVFALRHQALYVMLPLSLGLYGALVLVLRVFSADETRLFRQLLGRLWRKVVGARAASGEL